MPLPRRPRSKQPHRDRPYADKSRGVRLQKILAEAGIDSRRHCEELIAEGRVTVNGTVVDSLPAWADPVADRVCVDGQPIRRPGRRGHEHFYILLNKPRNVVCTNSDPEGRKRAIDLIDHPARPRLFCVGRLDADSVGLLVLTNDGELANRLTHPRYGIHKTYEVTVKGALQKDDIERLQRGLFLAERRSARSPDAPAASRTEPVRIRLLGRDRDRTHLEIQLREGRNRQIRRMLARLGHDVKLLRRVRMGPLKLSGIASGRWRPLTSVEVAALRRAADRAARPTTGS